MEKDLKNDQILESFLFSLKLDRLIQTNGPLNLENSFKEAEKFIGDLDLDLIINQLKESHWCMDFIYLDTKINRFKYVNDETEGVSKEEE